MIARAFLCAFVLFVFKYTAQPRTIPTAKATDTTNTFFVRSKWLKNTLIRMYLAKSINASPNNMHIISVFIISPAAKPPASFEINIIITHIRVIIPETRSASRRITESVIFPLLRFLSQLDFAKLFSSFFTSSRVTIFLCLFIISLTSSSRRLFCTGANKPFPLCFNKSVCTSAFAGGIYCGVKSAILFCSSSRSLSSFRQSSFFCFMGLYLCEKLSLFS